MKSGGGGVDTHAVLQSTFFLDTLRSAKTTRSSCSRRGSLNMQLFPRFPLLPVALWTLRRRLSSDKQQAHGALLCLPSRSMNSKKTEALKQSLDVDESGKSCRISYPDQTFAIFALKYWQ